MIMLHEFLTQHRDELIERCRAKVAKRPAPSPTELELKHGIPDFLEQLTRALRAASEAERRAIAGPKEQGKTASPSEIGDTAATHGNELLKKGYTVDQVVHDYGDLCQAVTELAVEQKASITNAEFRTLNGCLDNAIAGAVTEYGRQSALNASEAGTAAANERLGVLAHELRNLLNSAMLAAGAIKSGKVGWSGATGAVLERSLIGLRDLVDRSLAEVRLGGASPARRELFSVDELLDEVQVSGALEAQSRGVAFSIERTAEGMQVDADRQLLHSAIANLLQNAFKFTKPNGHVALRAKEAGGRLLLEIEDQCGGLPAGIADELFQPFRQRSRDRSGLGLGLSISRRAVEANGGTLTVRSLADSGCVFTIALPAAAG
jgi:signal transduction histidine kinase